jgi:5-methylcytosine-specific restriction endonuclease McrA
MKRSEFRRKAPLMSAEARFLLSVEDGPIPQSRPDLGPCLIYQGAVNTGGYGQFRYGGRNGYAHRYAWERIRGPIEGSLTIDHLCRVRRCVRFGHLELVDAVTNYMRAVAVRTGCHRGHPYTAENTGWRRGRRECLTCKRDTSRRCDARRKAARGPVTFRYDQALIRKQIVLIRAAESTIAQSARVIGCNPNYLGRRVWNETKVDVRQRDGSCCRCGSVQNLDVHHRLPRRMGGASKPETSFGMANLVCLCRPCHAQVESFREDAEAAGWLVPQGVTPKEWPVLRFGKSWEQPGDGWVKAEPHPRQIEMMGAA